MKFSTKSRYAIRVLVELARHQGAESPVTLHYLSEDQAISLKYLSRLLPVLVQNGLIQSLRGWSGGYRLVKDPREITFLEVIEMMDGPLTLTPCARTQTACSVMPECLMPSVWGRVSREMRDTLAKITLQAVLEDIESRTVSKK